jgi:hypothetical protein
MQRPITTTNTIHCSRASRFGITLLLQLLIFDNILVEKVLTFINQVSLRNSLKFYSFVFLIRSIIIAFLSFFVKHLATNKIINAIIGKKVRTIPNILSACFWSV